DRIAAERIEHEHVVTWQLGILGFLLQGQASITQLTVTLCSSGLCVRIIRKPLSGRGHIDHRRIDLVERQEVPLVHVGRESSGAKPNVANAQTTRWAVVAEVIEYEANAALP